MYGGKRVKYNFVDLMESFSPTVKLFSSILVIYYLLSPIDCTGWFCLLDFFMAYICNIRFLTFFLMFLVYRWWRVEYDGLTPDVPAMPKDIKDMNASFICVENQIVFISLILIKSGCFHCVKVCFWRKYIYFRIIISFSFLFFFVIHLDSITTMILIALH